MVARALIVAAFLILAGCVTPGGTFCDIAKPIRLTDEQVDKLSDAQAAEFLAHNLKGQKLCGWVP
jgi:hypothetical protein